MQVVELASVARVYFFVLFAYMRHYIKLAYLVSPYLLTRRIADAQSGAALILTKKGPTGEPMGPQIAIYAARISKS